MKRIADIILLLVAVLLLLLLIGCARNEPVSSTISDNAITATNGLEQSLPKECKSESVITQLTVIKTEIRAARNACEVEKEVITQEKLRWMWSFWALAIVVGAYMIKKVLK